MTTAAPPAPQPHRSYRYYDLVMANFVTVLLCSNLIGPGKTCELWLLGVPLVFSAGNLFFPISYIFGDVLTEVYGFARTRKVIWAGFGALFFAATMSSVVVAMPGSPDEPFNAVLQPALESVFGTAPQRYDDRGERPERQDRPERQERQERGGDRHDRSDRQPRHERGERHERQQDRQQFRNRDHHQHSARADAVRHDPGRAEQPVIPMGEPVAAVHASPARAEGGRPERSERPERADRGGERAPGRRPPQRFDRETQEQPEFLRRPVRRPRRDAAEAGDGEAPARDAEEKPVA